MNRFLLVALPLRLDHLNYIVVLLSLNDIFKVNRTVDVLNMDSPA
jgi:hypothetical protein